MYSGELVFDEADDEIIPSKDNVRRLAIIDGCNVLHACAFMTFYYKEGLKDADDRKPDAIGLMLMVKRLIEEGYDVRIFTSPSYMSEKIVDNCFILEQFKTLGILSVVEMDEHDDHIILKFATETGGFIISRDRYRDYMPIPQLIEATRRVISFNFNHVSLEDIGGNGALGDCRNHFCFGMKVAINLNPAICSSHIEKDRDFLFVHSQRRQRSKSLLSQTIRRIYLMADFLQRELCSIFYVKPPPLLPFFHEDYVLPAKFQTYIKEYDKWIHINSRKNEEENIFAI